MSSLLAGRTGYPSYLYLSSVGSSGTLTEIAGITKIGGLEKTRKTLPLDLLATTDGYEQVIPGGETKTTPMEMTGVYLSTNTHHTSMLPDLMDASARVGWKIAVAGTSSNSIWYGDAFIESYKLGDLLDEKVTFTFSLKPTGKPTGPASSTT
jgi:hypothetical protein